MTTRLTVSISAPAIRPTASWPQSSAAKPPLGKLDDAYAIAVSVAKLLRGTERDVILRHWLGEPETIDSVRAWLDYFDNKLGSGLMKKVMHTLRRA